MFGINKIVKDFFYRILVGLNRRFSYPLIYSSWSHLSASLLLPDVLSTGYFRRTLKPVEPDLTQYKNVVVLAPHHDDESIGCGGLLNKIKGNAKITVIFLTDGFQSSMNTLYNNKIIETREEEARNALGTVGADIKFLRLPNEDLKISSEAISALQNSLEDIRPDLILSVWMYDRPVKHRICHLITINALSGIKALYKVPIWFYQVHNVLFPNIIVDISNEVKLKEQMILCYTSQLKVAAYDRYIIGMNKWNAQYHQTKKEGWSEIYFGTEVSDAIKYYNRTIKDNMEEYLNW